jgi:hypothetical protein
MFENKAVEKRISGRSFETMSGRGDYGIYRKPHTRAKNLWKNKKILFGRGLLWREQLQKSGQQIVRIPRSRRSIQIFGKQIKMGRQACLLLRVRSSGGGPTFETV